MKLRHHDRYDYVPLTRPARLQPGRAAAGWPSISRLNLEHFSFGEGLGAELAPGGPQPDVLNYAWRDYGNRVGAWYLLDAFDALRPADGRAGQQRAVRLRARSWWRPAARAATRSSATAAPMPSGRATLDEAAERALIGEATARHRRKARAARRKAGSARGFRTAT